MINILEQKSLLAFDKFMNIEFLGERDVYF